MPENPRVDLVHKAICGGWIEFKGSCLQRFRADPELKGFTDVGIRKLMREYVAGGGGQCRHQKESDTYWLQQHPDDPWWYFVVIPVPEFPRGLFVKMKLLWEDGDSEDDAFVQIVSIHEEKEGKIL